MTKISLINDTIDSSDINHLIEWLKTHPRLTKGPVTDELETKWSKWLGTKHSVFVNSGSSANLLMLQALLESGKINPGAKVAVPTISWATDLAPIIQLGLTPVLCDIDLDTLSLSISHLTELCKENIDVVISVAVLGLVPPYQEIIKLQNKYGFYWLEDCCEAVGSCAEPKLRARNVGRFGDMSSFSTYFGHHISTIEGGFVCTNDTELYNILKSIRSHGWNRDMDSNIQQQLRNEWEVSEFDDLYTFYYSGFNVRSTDLQAFIGLRQIDKLENICSLRYDNFLYYQTLIKNDFWKPIPVDGTFTSNFAYPIIHPKRNKIVKILQENDVEVRPMICGSMGTQPFYVKKYGVKKFMNTSVVDAHGFYVPNHPGLTLKNIEFISNIINEVIE